MRESNTFVKLVEDLLTAICKDLLGTVALEGKFHHVLTLLSRNEVDAVVIVKCLFFDQNIPKSYV